MTLTDTILENTCKILQGSGKGIAFKLPIQFLKAVHFEATFNNSVVIALFCS